MLLSSSADVSVDVKVEIRKCSETRQFSNFPIGCVSSGAYGNARLSVINLAPASSQRRHTRLFSIERGYVGDML